MNNFDNLVYGKIIKDSIPYKLNKTSYHQKKHSLLNSFNDNYNVIFPKLNKEKFEENENGLYSIYENIKIIYNEKRYNDIIQIVSQKEKLFCNDSTISFNLLFIKIKCQFKNIQFQFEKLFNNEKSKNLYYKIEKNLLNIQQDFEKMISLSNGNSQIQEEKSIQLYSKILFYYSYLWRLKDNYIKALSYLTLALNLLKIYFLKFGFALEQSIYSIYGKVLLFTINLLIEDNNYKKAIYYQNILLNVIISAIKFQKVNENKLIKYCYYLFFTFLLNGITNDLLNDEIQAFDSYKQAYYICRKKVFKFEDIYINLSHRILISILNKFEDEKEFKKKQYLKLNEVKKLEEMNKIRNKKKEKLFLIANGYVLNNKRFKKTETNIKRLLSDAKKKEIKRLDSELERFVYSNKDFNNPNPKEKSPKTKNHLCNYELYSKLLTEEYKDFIIKNDNLQLNNPEKEKEAIEKINKYINKKIEMQMSKSKSEKIINPDEVILEEVFINKNDSEVLNKIKNHKKNKIKSFSKGKLNLLTTRSPSLFRISKKDLPFDFERNYLDKNLLSKNYYNKYMRLEKLTSQELNFQKTLLGFKSQFSKNFFSQNSNDLFLSEDDIENSIQRKYNLINNSIKDNLIKNKFDKEKEELTDVNENSEILYNKVFKRKDRRLMNNSFNKVFKNYIKKMKKEREEKKKCNDPVYVRKRNENQLLKINDEIDFISQNLEEKKIRLKNKIYN